MMQAVSMGILLLTIIGLTIRDRRAVRRREADSSRESGE